MDLHLCAKGSGEHHAHVTQGWPASTGAHAQWVSDPWGAGGPAHPSSQDPVSQLLSEVLFPRLALATVGVFILWKAANTANRTFENSLRAGY